MAAVDVAVIFIEEKLKALGILLVECNHQRTIMVKGFDVQIKFKNETDDGKIAYWKGVRIGVMIFLFASIIESVIVIAHIMWIDPTFISVINDQKIELAQSLGFSDNLMEELKKQTSFSPFVFVINQILNNVFIGFILSLLITPVASKIDINIRNIDK